MLFQITVAVHSYQFRDLGSVVSRKWWDRLDYAGSDFLRWLKRRLNWLVLQLFTQHAYSMILPILHSWGELQYIKYQLLPPGIVSFLSSGYLVEENR